jgi:hypothetical protein
VRHFLAGNGKGAELLPPSLKINLKSYGFAQQDSALFQVSVFSGEAVAPGATRKLEEYQAAIPAVRRMKSKIIPGRCHAEVLYQQLSLRQLIVIFGHMALHCPAKSLHLQCCLTSVRGARAHCPKHFLPGRAGLLLYPR